MGLVSWSDFDDCYTALIDSGLDIAEERTLQFHAWRLAFSQRRDQPVGHLDEDGEGMYARITHDDVSKHNATVGDPVYLSLKPRNKPTHYAVVDEQGEIVQAFKVATYRNAEFLCKNLITSMESHDHSTCDWTVKGVTVHD